MTHFERLGIPYLPPVPILGNAAPNIFQRMSLVENIHQVYNSFQDVKYFGFYNLVMPIYAIRDPELIVSVTIKNFDYFYDRNFIDEKVDPIAGKTLFVLKGDN